MKYPDELPVAVVVSAGAWDMPIGTHVEIAPHRHLVAADWVEFVPPAFLDSMCRSLGAHKSCLRPLTPAARAVMKSPPVPTWD